MNPITAALTVVIVFGLLCAGFGLLIVLGEFADWNEREKRGE